MFASKTAALFAATVILLALPAPTTDAESLYSLLNKKQYIELERKLTTAHLSEPDAAFFRGVLANRKNRIQESIQLLEPLAKRLGLELQSQQEMETLRTLADDYCKIFDYAKAEEAFSKVLLRYSDSLSQKQRRSISDRLEEMRILRDAPRQTAELNGGFTLAFSRNQMGLLEIPVDANRHSESWVLDTGANTSVVTETTARRIGIQLLEGIAHTSDISGLPVTYRIGILPELKIGTAVLHNVELPVTSDKNLNFGGIQLQGIVGFPVQAALQRITFAPDHIAFNADSENDPGSEMFMEEQTPIVSAQIDSTVRLFSLDTGATGSMFSVRLYNALASKLAASKRRKMDINGAGGTHLVQGYDIKNFQLQIGGQRAALAKASILAEFTQSSLDDFFGNIGQDVLGSFKSYTIDFSKMSFQSVK